MTEMELAHGFTEATDVPSPAQGSRGVWILYLVLWGLVVVGAAAIAALTGQYVVAAAIVLPFTLAGIVWKPVFGICLFFAVLPISRSLVLLGAEQGGWLSAARIVAVLYALGTLPQLLSGRLRLAVRHPTVLALFAFFVLSALSRVWARWPDAGVRAVLTFAQMLILAVLFLSHFRRDPSSLLWALRSFAGACLLVSLLTPLHGVVSETHQRVTISFGEESLGNPNDVAFVLGLGLLSAAYLFRIDRGKAFKALWVAALVVLPVVIVMTGSRQALVAGTAALVLPLLFVRQMVRRPVLLLGILLLLAVVGGSTYFAYQHLLKGEQIERVTDIESAKEGVALRVDFIREAVAYVMENPLGAGIGNFYTSGGHTVHNDFFYVLSSLGLPGAAVWLGWVIATIIMVRRRPAGAQQWFARAVLIFILLVGLVRSCVFLKAYWVYMLLITLVGQAALSQRERPYEDLDPWEGAESWEAAG